MCFASDFQVAAFVGLKIGPELFSVLFAMKLPLGDADSPTAIGISKVTRSRRILVAPLRNASSGKGHACWMREIEGIEARYSSLLKMERVALVGA